MFGCLQVSNGQTGQAVLGSVLDSVRQRLLASIMLVAVRYLLDVLSHTPVGERRRSPISSGANAFQFKNFRFKSFEKVLPKSLQYV